MIEFARQTVATTCRFEGLGLHSGVQVAIAVSPGCEGIQIQAGDDRFLASPEAVTDTARCTRLGPASTLEHLLAALAGLGITDAEVAVEGGEAPAADGSAAPFASGLREAGLQPLAPGRVEGLYERVFYAEGATKIAIAPGEGHWRYEFDSGERWPGVQAFDIRLTPEAFGQEVAPARTFAFEEEVEPLRQAGLGRGLDAGSCLVLGQGGYVNAPRFPDEPARHKLLDLVGDLSLAGIPPTLLNVSAFRTGHRANVAAAARLAARLTVRR
jgi:UDP-3-O-[3-hydroxymyristoyl] N-acetylglucosamine deacetylase